MTGNYYGICYNGISLIAIPNPQHNKYPGYVYGTLQPHSNATSAIEEYRRLVEVNRSGEGEAESVAAADLERIPGLVLKADHLAMRCLFSK